MGHQMRVRSSKMRVFSFDRYIVCSSTQALNIEIYTASNGFPARALLLLIIKLPILSSTSSSGGVVAAQSAASAAAAALPAPAALWRDCVGRHLANRNEMRVSGFDSYALLFLYSLSTSTYTVSYNYCVLTRQRPQLGRNDERPTA